MKLGQHLSLLSPDELDDERWNYLDYTICIETEQGPQRISGVQWDHEKQLVIFKTGLALSLLTPE